MRNIQFNSDIPDLSWTVAPLSVTSIANLATDTIIDKNFVGVPSETLSTEGCDAIYFELC